jgi:hypothetical protein
VGALETETETETGFCSIDRLVRCVLDMYGINCNTTKNNQMLIFVFPEIEIGF